LLVVISSLLGAAKLESFGPEPPAKPFPRAEPNTLPLPSPPKPDEAEPPKPNPEDGWVPDKPPKPVVVVVDVELEDFVLANPPKPDVEDWVAPPKTLGLDALIVPNGDVVEEAREPNPELAKAEADVWGTSVFSFGESSEVFFDGSFSADAVLLSRGSAAAACITRTD